jgi:phosphoserine phosphatase
MAKKKTIPMAICYDFDGTLAPGNMQEHNFLPELGIEPLDFWVRVEKLAQGQDSDEILAYMKLMIDLARESHVPVRREDFLELGSKLDFFPGISTWFSRINEYALAKGVKIDHFIISSGLREMIEGTPIAREFTKIYASGFMYDENGVAVWPALAINYTTKTQFLFRINKGTLDAFDNSVINKFVPKGERPMPFENMVYIGDGETDIPCFRLVKEEGGYSIAVYPKSKKGAKAKIVKLTAGERANLITPADYEDGSVIDRSVKAIIDKLEAASRIGSQRG